MAITQSNTVQGANIFIADLISSTADTTSAVFAHGLDPIPATAGTPFAGMAPLVEITPIGADGRLCNWVLASVNSTGYSVSKATTSLSGGAAVSCRVVVRRPHSIFR